MSTPPRADRHEHALTFHGDTRIDPYYWLMEKENPAVLELLTAENNFRSNALAHLSPLEADIFTEVKSRIEETDTSVPVRMDEWWYFERTREGLNYAVNCRVPVGADRDTPPTVDPESTLPGEQVVLDENVEAGDGDFLSVGILSISPDDQWVAVGLDREGNEEHHVTFRRLDTGEAAPDSLSPLNYSLTWSMDNTCVWYTVNDEASRPWQVWRHRLGTPQSDDVLVFQEDDEMYWVDVARTRDDEKILISTSSKTTSEVRYLDARSPEGSFTILDPRRDGVDYDIEHYRDGTGRGWWLKISNDNATDFALWVRPDDLSSDWVEAIAERRGVRLQSIDAYANFFAITERSNGLAAVRLVPHGGAAPTDFDIEARSYLVAGDVDPSTIVPGGTPSYDAHSFRVVTTSLITPRTVSDIDVESGAATVRKQQIVKGDFDPEKYRTGRIWATASDGTKIPVSVVARRDLVDVAENGDLIPVAPAPVLQYGYGSYEISIDPSFSVFRLSLLDRGIIFAIAHIRGGGEMGRRWYEEGRLAQKATTFSDFIAVSRHLIDERWTTPEQLAARGGSAGGLLMGAIANQAPELYRAIVAEVPFVDALTTILDPSLPLTVTEWEEWGNPLDNESIYRIMKGYAPYDNVRSTNDDGTPRVYPDLYLTAGLNDTRVGYWEAAKFAQKVRDANPDNNVYVKIEMGAGHAGPSGRYDAWKDEAATAAFIVSRITRR
jgi:oligopeptidase B